MIVQVVGTRLETELLEAFEKVSHLGRKIWVTIRPGGGGSDGSWKRASAEKLANEEEGYLVVVVGEGVGG